MAWSATLDTLLASGLPIERSYTLEIRNGYQGDAGDPFIEIPIAVDSWSKHVVDGNPVVGTCKFSIPLDSFEHLEEFNGMDIPTASNTPVTQFASVRLKLTIVYPASLGGGSEAKYIYRGSIKTKQIINANLSIYCLDLMDKMRTCLFDTVHAANPVILGFQMIANIYSPPGSPDNISIVHASNWDDGADEFTFEVERIGANNFAFYGGAAGATASRRAWVPAAFTIEWDKSGGWEKVPATEYEVDCQMGLLRFNNNQQPDMPFNIRMVDLSVYIEGTLELADVLEAIFRFNSDCPYLGCGLPLTSCQTALTGTFTLTNGNTAVNGVGCAFDTELNPGDRIAHNATDTVYGIVESIAGANALTLRYAYKGLTAAGLAGYVSTFQASGISLSQINWTLCDGTAADLYRRLQENYGDSRGYKVFWDYENNKVIGKRVAIDVWNSIKLLRPTDLMETLTTEDFASAVVVTGDIGRAHNLATAAATTITLAAGPPFSWGVQPGYNGWDGIVWALNQAENESALAGVCATCDAYPGGPMSALECVGAVNYDSGHGALIDTAYRNFVDIDLGAIYQLSKIVAYNLPVKNSAQSAMGVTITGSTDGATFSIMTPETQECELAANEAKDFDLENSSPVRYIRISCRGYKWGVSNANNKVIGFREILIYGSQTVCESVCIQDAVAPGINIEAGTITFDHSVDSPPFGVTGVGTNFVADLVVGDWIALNAERSYWSKVKSIGGALVLEIEDRYPGIPNANGVWGTAAFVEGAGGHFIGGSGVDDDFIIDYYPDLMKKMFHVKQSVKFDDSQLVLSQMMARDRAYLLLNECIRLFREIGYAGLFDPRLNIFDTAKVIDDYRIGTHDDLFYLVQKLITTDSDAIIDGIEYGASPNK